MSIDVVGTPGVFLGEWDRNLPFTLTKGVYDILHVGHLDSFEYAKSLGLPLVVGVYDDESVGRRKGPQRPINPATSRARLVAALKPVDAVVVFGGLSPFDLIAELRPEFFVATHLGQLSLDEADLVRVLTKFREIPKDAGVSTSAIIT